MRIACHQLQLAGSTVTSVLEIRLAGDTVLEVAGGHETIILVS